MICPKCKKQIPEKALKCGFCGTRVATTCKKCGAYNSVYNLKCVNCGDVLLKICPSCKSVNLPDANKCRKCGYVFKEKSTTIADNIGGESDFSIPDYDAQLYSQQNAKEILKKAFASDGKKIISINGEKGIGKSIVLKSAINEFDFEEKIWLVGECSPITQLSPCGLIQNVLLTFFNVPTFCIDNLQLKKESQSFFQSEFPTLTNEEIFNLLNFLYPKNTAYYENILLNKDKTFVFLEKLFRTIVETRKTVFIIENFDFIDGLSYEFIHHLINTDMIENKLKILLTYSEKRPVQGYLYNSYLKDENYLDISLSLLEKSQMELFIDRFFENAKCPVSIKNKLALLSRGNPAVLEQYIGLLLDKKRTNTSFSDFPSNVNFVLKERLELLKKNWDAYRILVIAAIQGLNFSPTLINEVLQLNEEIFVENLNLLQGLNLIIPITQHVYSFKNTLVWNEIFEILKKDEEFIDYNSTLLEVLKEYTLSSNSIMAILSQNIKNNNLAFEYWTKNIKLAAYIGDTNLYAISQKQCLTFIDTLTDADTELVKNNIYERLGKLLAKTNPEEAIKYLPNAIENAKLKGNKFKEIELTGYMAECCMKQCNYNGVIECVDSVLQKLDMTNDLEIAMVKSRKLKPLFSIGNSGELISIADNEIMPVFEKYLNAKPHKNISIQNLYKSWLETYLYLAKALIFQGNSRAFEVIATLFELFEKNNFTDRLFICKTKLAFAFANTMKGDIQASEETLSEVLQTYKTDIMDNDSICEWNIINILNNFINKNYTGLKEELFQVVTFANNVNDNFTKNILKTLLGKLLRDEESIKQALEIYSQQITYFSKEKNAIGALLAWYLIAEARLVTDGPQKSIEISQKALEISKNPKINNYIFIVLFNKLIAEANIISGDFEAAKIHIEKAIMFARKFELLHLLSELYLLYGKYLQDFALVKTDSQAEYIVSAVKMYKKALNEAQNIRSQLIMRKTEQAFASLKSFCSLNKIDIQIS